MSKVVEMPAPSSQRRILIVDDVEDNRIVLDRFLRRSGYATDMSVDGISALNAVSASPPDLILLDWMMPGLSGLDTLKAIRERYDENQMPVIMCTAIGEETSVVVALKAGANDFVMKPISYPVLLARLKAQLVRKETVILLQKEKEDLESMLLQRTRDLLNRKQNP
ncbi:response regulator transcription factor [Asticcacaulis benevestitus]|uniref:Response regulatory domain-containing protein n=1 Tax=Asticcacaulis benevestitus DSM 16100 = ATCC BAA-896 TaxID=1121022 RepID=V4PU43_9CAUL|nr:response regulator [Asticcacaulis benevestitus]ESQ91886.1 hypothetical protein ABENE_09640 [Asticcacaulis benevestitus DSM 16100 = ATCC BAA-896]